MLDLAEALACLPSRRLSVKAGQSLFCRDDAVRCLFIVRAGCVHLSRCDANGADVVVQRATAGAILAESSIFSDRYHCDATAVAAGELQRIGKPTVLAEMARSPALLEVVARHLAREVQRTRGRAEVLAKRTVRERLDAWLALNEAGLPPSGSWRTVAEDIGVSPEAFYRELQRRRALRGS